jgi:hypothetical protein
LICYFSYLESAIKAYIQDVTNRGQQKTKWTKSIKYDKVLDNVKAPKLKVGDMVRGSRVKGLFKKGYLTN